MIQNYMIPTYWDRRTLEHKSDMVLPIDIIVTTKKELEQRRDDFKLHYDPLKKYLFDDNSIYEHHSNGYNRVLTYLEGVPSVWVKKPNVRKLENLIQ